MRSVVNCDLMNVAESQNTEFYNDINEETVFNVDLFFPRRPFVQHGTGSTCRSEREWKLLRLCTSLCYAGLARPHPLTKF